MWSLYADQGYGFKRLAERAGPDQLKSIARELHNSMSNRNPARVKYRIYSPSGILRFMSTKNNNWRMRWKKPRQIETINDLLTDEPRSKTA